MKVIGVTGGSGFIGGHIIETLSDNGYETVAFDRTNKGQTFADEYMLGDVTSQRDVTELAAHVDGIIHMAAVLGTQETVGNPGPAAETNILGGVNVLNACRQYDIPLVYAGVGNYWMRNTYSTTKHAVERLLEQYRDEFKLPFATVRPMNAYGPRQRTAPPFGAGKVRKIFPAFVCRALTDKPIEVYGTGEQISDMVFVKDVANVFVKTFEALSSGTVLSQAVEVGPIESLKVREVAEFIAKFSAQFTGKLVPIVNLPMRPGEKDRNDISAESLQKLMKIAEDFPSKERSITMRTIKTLTNIVTADVSTLSEIKVNPNDFTKFEVGAKETVEWYKNNMGTFWEEASS